jgi:formylglycine-generating enzyme required for sulfatase activity
MLKIITEPGDAKIFIDGERKGNSPEQAGQSFAIKLPEGSYTIKAHKPDGDYEYTGNKTDVFVAKNSLQTIQLKLARSETETGRLVREERARKEKAEREELARKEKAEMEDTIRKKYPNGLPVSTMISIPAGSFQMGCVSGKNCYDSEKPVHTVTVPAFELGKTEVTFEQWDACVALGGCDHLPDDRGWGRGNRPVINVSWDDVQQYIAWLNQETSKNYRLPSEAEWEYAARAGTKTTYWWGNDVGKNNANCDGCGSQWDNKTTAPVGSFKPNPFGLYDTAGNVWEWTQDCWNKSYQAAPADGSTWQTGDCSYRVGRGGSWYGCAGYSRSANRCDNSHGARIDNQGFRLARGTHR